MLFHLAHWFLIPVYKNCFYKIKVNLKDQNNYDEQDYITVTEIKCHQDKVINNLLSSILYAAVNAKAI